MAKQKTTPVADKKATSAVAPATTATATAARPATTEITREQVARRAYELYLARGGEHGRHDEDWQQAERELRLGRQ